MKWATWVAFCALLFAVSVTGCATCLYFGSRIDDPDGYAETVAVIWLVIGGIGLTFASFGMLVAALIGPPDWWRRG